MGGHSSITFSINGILSTNRIKHPPKLEKINCNDHHNGTTIKQPQSPPPPPQPQSPPPQQPQSPPLIPISLATHSSPYPYPSQPPPLTTNGKFPDHNPKPDYTYSNGISEYRGDFRCGASRNGNGVHSNGDHGNHSNHGNGNHGNGSHSNGHNNGNGNGNGNGSYYEKYEGYTTTSVEYMDTTRRQSTPARGKAGGACNGGATTGRFRPPPFFETVLALRKRLYYLGGKRFPVDEPPMDRNIHKLWRAVEKHKVTYVSMHAFL